MEPPTDTPMMRGRLVEDDEVPSLEGEGEALDVGSGRMGIAGGGLGGAGGGNGGRGGAGGSEPESEGE